MSVPSQHETRMARTASALPRSQDHYISRTAQRFSPPMTASQAYHDAAAAYRSVSPMNAPFPNFAGSGHPAARGYDMPTTSSYMDPRIPSTRSYMDPRIPSTRSYMDPRTPSTRSYMDSGHMPPATSTYMPSTRSLMDNSIPYTARDYRSPRCASPFSPQGVPETRSQFPLPVFPNY